MLGLAIVALTELRRPRAEREMHRKIEADRIEYMWEDVAIAEWQLANKTEQRRRRNGLAHRKVTPQPVHRSRKSSLKGGFPW